MENKDGQINSPSQNNIPNSATYGSERKVPDSSSSVGRGKTPTNRKKKGTISGKKGKEIAKAASLVLVGFLALHGAIDIAENIYERVEYYSDGKEATSIATSEAMQKLKDYGLAVVTNKGETVLLADNDYSVLNASTPEEIFAYYKAIDDSEEFEKFIQDVSYQSDYNYTNTKQFLIVNGFVDPETNEASLKVWENVVKDHLITSYRNGEIESIFYNGSDSYTSDGLTPDYIVDYNVGNEYSEGRKR